MSANSLKLIKFVNKFPIFKKIYFFYNIYIRNYKFYFNGSQFGEDKEIEKLFDRKKIGKYVDVGCFHPSRSNNTFKLYKKGWKGINVDLDSESIKQFNLMRKNDHNVNALVTSKDNEERCLKLTKAAERNKTKIEKLKKIGQVNAANVLRNSIEISKRRSQITENQEEVIADQKHIASTIFN